MFKQLFCSGIEVLPKYWGEVRWQHLCTNYSLHGSLCITLPPNWAPLGKCSVSPCILALQSFFKLFVISGKKNDSGSEERRGKESYEEGEGGDFPVSVIFRLNCSQGWNSLYSTPLSLRKEERHFLYTWPMDAINKQVALMYTSNCERRHISVNDEWKGGVSAEWERWNNLKEEAHAMSQWKCCVRHTAESSAAACVRFSSRFNGLQRETISVCCLPVLITSAALAFCSHSGTWLHLNLRSMDTQIGRSFAHGHLCTQSASGCQYGFVMVC